MPEHQQRTAPGVTVFTSALYQTTSTVLETPDAIFIVDPNWLPHEVLLIRSFVDSVRRQKKVFLIFTHGDYDHIIGRGAFPEARVIASRGFVRHPDKDAVVRQIGQFDRQHYISRDYQIDFPKVDIEIFQDGKAMHFSGHVLTFYLAPGHTDDGMYIVFEPNGVLIAGDYLSDIEPPFISSIKRYRRTMAKIDRLLRIHQIDHLIPGHGSCADRRELILQRRDQAVEYLDDLEASAGVAANFPEAKYRERYPFWDGIIKEHHENLALVSAQQ